MQSKSTAVERDCVVAVDVGGTCTDCVVVRPGSEPYLGKVFSTPPDFAHGVLDSVAAAAGEMGLQRDELLARTRLFLHGSTVVDNTLFTRDGAVTGLITTAGFEDTLLMTRRRVFQLYRRRVRIVRGGRAGGGS